MQDIVALCASLGDGTTTFILDCEIVAIDGSGKVLPFQTLASRARKNVQLKDITVQVRVCAFDLLYHNEQV